MPWYVYGPWTLGWVVRLVHVLGIGPFQPSSGLAPRAGLSWSLLGRKVHGPACGHTILFSVGWLRPEQSGVA
jgi:hypothetical protein